MRGPSGKTLLWQLAGLICYFVGLVVFVTVALYWYFSSPAFSLGTISPVLLVYMVGGLVSLIAGLAISRKYSGETTPWKSSWGGFDARPEQTQLEQLGYRVPPETSPETRPDHAYEDGELYVVCAECGAKNERGFRYCGDCSAELPE